MLSSSAHRIPSGIADSESKIAYVQGKDGHIFGLALETGELVASTDFAALPLAYSEGQIICWSHLPHRPNQVRLHAVVRQGRELIPQWEQTLALPEWVDVNSPEPDGFKLEVAVDEKRVTAAWEAHARYRGGAPPPIDVEQAALRAERRTLHLDTKSGALLGKELVDPVPPPEHMPPPPKPNKQIVPYRIGTSWATQPWRSGAARACLIKAMDRPGIVLLREDALGAETEVRLADHPETAATVTLDGGMIFIQDPGETGPVWQVFATETGKRLASLDFDPGTDGIAVIDAHILYVRREDIQGMRRRTLECRAFPSGKPLWSFVLDEEIVKAPPPLPR
jgi:hypothetical protein